jgi:ribosomal protein S14
MPEKIEQAELCVPRFPRTVACASQRCTTDGRPHAATRTVACASQRCTTDGRPHAATRTVTYASQRCTTDGRPHPATRTVTYASQRCVTNRATSRDHCVAHAGSSPTQRARRSAAVAELCDTFLMSRRLVPPNALAGQQQSPSFATPSSCRVASSRPAGAGPPPGATESVISSRMPQMDGNEAS